MLVNEQAERFQEITNFGVIPSPSGADTLLLHGENDADCLLVMQVFKKADHSNEVAIVTFTNCQQSIFGYPNDEAYESDPRGTIGDEASYGFFEVLSSSWPARLAEYNRRAFPDTRIDSYQALRHYFVGCHDASGEFLAEDLHVELPGGDYRTIAQIALDRLFQR